jgi:hypothetical protein
MDTEIVQPPHLTNSRLLILGASAVVLCMSFIISVFAPFPLALAIVLYGRVKGYLTGMIGLLASFLIATFLYRDLTLVVFFACVFILGAGIAEIILRGAKPVKGLVGFGLGFILTVVAAFGLYFKSLEVTPKQYVLQQIEKSADRIAEQKKIVEESGGADSIQVLQLLDRPELIAKEVIESFPGYFFIGVFIMLWFNMFLVLKSRRLLLAGNDYPYTERDLLSFRVPFGFVLLLMLGLVFAIWGQDFGTRSTEVIGYTIIKCLGIFYFFQGFGVMTDLLNFLGIMGFFRVFIVMAVILMANYMVAVAGLLDNWFDFRKYFVKRNTED